MNTLDGAARAEPKRAVLYVEVQPAHVHLMRAIFSRRQDCALAVATDGRSGLLAAQVLRPDLLLLDINLPDTLGTLLLAQHRLMRGWAEIPAVAVTANHGFDIRGTTFCEIWPKPLEMRDTLLNLARLLP